ncbi:MAG TPA: cell division protein FtsZ, partial [Steroidobacteraceae bacterium]|nr:cell division protein FtsZ [Steroidobacteraceae bacterium]
NIAEQGMAELAKHCDSLITIPNQKLLTVLGGDVTLLDAFKAANQVLQGAVQGIAEVITRPGMINVDFADVRTVMAETGMAMMGSGTARGENRAREAAEAAISSPLLEDVNLTGAHGLLINVTSGPDLRVSEFSLVGETIKKYVSEDANVVVGWVVEQDMREDIRVTVVATGIGRPEEMVQPQLDARRMTAVTGGRAQPRHVPTLDDLSVPTVLRRQREQGGETMMRETHTRRAVGDGLAMSDDLLDIPAFLRRQAD